MLRHVSLLLGCVLAPAVVMGVEPTRQEMRAAQGWAAAKFRGIAIKQPPHGYLEVSFKSGKLLKNMATTKVYHKEVGALPLKIVKQQYSRGLYCPSPGKVTVHLPAPGAKFQAVFGVDSNRVESFYSNSGRGRVVGSVNVGSRTVFRSPVMREGKKGVAVDVKLEGATQFTLAMTDSGGGVVERVDFNQSDWAEARVELVNGDIVWLGDLPVAPLAASVSTAPPFSFVYGGHASSKFLSTWRRQYQHHDVDQHRREHTLVFLDEKTGLQVRCVGVEYRRHPVVEWTLYFKNTSNRDTPIIEDILPLDLRLERGNEGEFQLYHNNGSPHSLVRMSDPSDYAPRQTTLPRNAEKRLGAKIGLPASHDLPFFNVEANGVGTIFAIGWPGQWSALLKRDKDRGLQLKAGQERTHFKLHPGEEVRSPLIAMLLWRGDRLRAQNLWRRWMIEHNLPRTGDGKLPMPQHAASSSAFFMESTGATEANQRMFIDRYVEEGLKPDYWWIDAGWYDYRDYWLNVGTWRPNPKRFPRGLKPISNYLHDRAMKMILWFTPECVTRGSEIDRTHPEFLLKGGGEWWMGHALMQGEYPGHVNDSGMTIMEDVAAFGIGKPTSTVTGKTRLSDGRWHLVTATRFINEEKQRSDLRLYIDGRLEASGTSPNVEPLNANSSWGVGRQYQTRGIRGEIDDVRVYDTALPADEVKKLFAGASSKRPTAHYAFDKSFRDQAGQLHGEYIGLGKVQYVAGVSGKAQDRALRFANNYGIKVPNKVPLNFTLSCWVRMDDPQPPPYGRGDFRLFNFADAKARKWITDLVDRQLRVQGVDFYRHDGIPPLTFWRANDTPDRQGITEIKHIEGLLAYWDELKRRHPMLRIDICSGGGSRNELETLRRAVPLWRSDYAYEPTGMQTLTYGMAMWIPYFGTGVNASDSYTFRSQFAPAIGTSWDVRRRDIDYKFRRRMLAERKSIIDHCYGDYYPLTGYRLDDESWMAWQFNRPETGSGVVQAFRRPKSPATTMQLRLHDLDPRATYTVKNFDIAGTTDITGAVLMRDGLTIALPRRRSAAIITYQRHR